MTNQENSGSARPFGFRGPRLVVNFSFSVEVIATGERYEAVCTDISEDGLAAELLEPLEAQTPVTMRMLLPGDVALLKLQGTVQYSKEGRCGLTFVYSSPQERRRIQVFLRSIS
jgi:PilZ domain